MVTNEITSRSFMVVRIITLKGIAIQNVALRALSSDVPKQRVDFFPSKDCTNLVVDLSSIAVEHVLIADFFVRKRKARTKTN